MEIGPPVLEKKIFEGFLPYMGVAAILVMWPASCHQIFISLYLKAFIQRFGQIGTAVSEKIQFEFLYVHDIGPRSRNDLDLQYSHIFIYSIRCMLLLTFRSLAAIGSEKSTVFTFSSVNIFKLEYLRNQWANRNQILSEASLGWGIDCIRFWTR